MSRWTGLGLFSSKCLRRRRGPGRGRCLGRRDVVGVAFLGHVRHDTRSSCAGRQARCTVSLRVPNVVTRKVIHGNIGVGHGQLGGQVRRPAVRDRGLIWEGTWHMHRHSGLAHLWPHNSREAQVVQAGCAAREGVGGQRRHRPAAARGHGRRLWRRRCFCDSMLAAEDALLRVARVHRRGALIGWGSDTVRHLWPVRLLLESIDWSCRDGRGDRSWSCSAGGLVGP